MPKKLHGRLARAARKKFGSTTSKHARRYIWGGLYNAKKKSRQKSRRRKR